MESKQIHKIPASEWSGYSTKRQSQIARRYAALVITWHGDDDLVIVNADSELAQRLLNELKDEADDD